MMAFSGVDYAAGAKRASAGRLERRENRCCWNHAQRLSTSHLPILRLNNLRTLKRLLYDTHALETELRACGGSYGHLYISCRNSHCSTNVRTCSKTTTFL